MRIATLLAILCGLVMLGASQANAGVQGTLALNQINELEDIDYESVAVDQNRDGKVNDGDLLVAILKISRLNLFDDKFDTSSNGIPNRLAPPHAEYNIDTEAFTGVSLLKVDGDPTVTTVAGVLESASYTFTAPSPAEWLAETALAGVDADTMLIMFDDPATAPIAHIDQNHVGGVSGSIGTATEGTRLWELGLKGDPGEFWGATTIDLNPLNGLDATDIAQITGLDFLAALNVIDQNAGIPLIKHGALLDPDVGPGTPPFTAMTDLQLQGNLETGGGGANFDIATDTNLYILPVPEPASLLTWAGLLGLLFVIRRRRA